MKPSWFRVLRCLDRGMILYEINAFARPKWSSPYDFGLDFGDCRDGPHPDKVYVSRGCNKWLQDSGYVAVTETHPMRDGQVDRTWRITDAGKQASRGA